tara:strand:- start:833 stop:1750 length:918 start_codon:yes stop_codon:yes gene_type:complete
MDNPYDLLGLKPSATADDVRKAYRKLAKKCHPDLHPGDAKAEARFKAVSQAQALLSDPEKRARFDAGEIDAAGNERAPEHFYHPHADSEDGARYARYNGGVHPDAMSDIFAELFRNQQDRAHVKMRGHDIHYNIDIPFLEAARGTKKRATMADGKQLDITIPEGLQSGQLLRLRGKGTPGLEGGPPGDAYIDVRVSPHTFFTRRGNDIHVTVPVTISEAVLGGKIKVPTINGTVEMTVPKHANTGAVLRLKERGVLERKSGKRGHQHVRLEVVLPEKPDKALDTFAAAWAETHKDDPRRAMLEAI